MNQLQQGDVCIQRIDSIPHDVVRVDAVNGSFVLAEGEVTGHAHRIHDRIKLFMDTGLPGSGVCYFETDSSVDLTHEEHNTVTIPPGRYRSFIVREYDHLEEATRRVVD